MNKKVHRKRSLLALLPTLILLGVVSWLYFGNGYQKVEDWWRLRRYTPTSEIKELANSAGFSEEGKRIFYLTYPQLNSSQSFNDNCSTENSIILGCYINGQIYIYDVDDNRIPQVEEVTAAHEMLHHVYSRLDDNEKSIINRQLNSVLEDVTEQSVLDLIDGYRQRGADLDNELHSILGTEIENLPKELEEHYSQYFSNRSTVTELAREYRVVFTNIQKDIDGLVQEIDQLGESIQNSRDALNSAQADINVIAQATEDSSDIDDFNSNLIQYTALVEQYNIDVGQLNSEVEQYNNKVAELGTLSANQADLYKQIDSNNFETKQIEL